MLKEKQVSLSTEELTVAFILCGYEDVGNQIIFKDELLKSKEKMNSFSKNIEDSLKLKGFWDGNRDSFLSEELENLIKVLALTKLKIRFVIGKKVVFIHKIKNDQFLFQFIQNGIHTISYIEGEDKIRNLISEILKLKLIDIPWKEWAPLMLDSETFDEIHSQSERSLKELAQNNIPMEMKLFIHDFISNNQEFDNVSCMVMDSEENQLHVVKVVFFIIGEKNIWTIDYENVNEDKIYILPKSNIQFSNEVTELVEVFLKEKI